MLHIKLTIYTFLLRYKLYQYENLRFFQMSHFMLDIVKTNKLEVIPIPVTRETDRQ